MTNEIFLNNNQKFHVFSKSPITPSQGLSQVVNKSGHTTTTADVWAQDIPWFFKADNKDVALSTGVDAKFNDMVLIGSAVYKRNKTEYTEGATFDDLWDSYVLENGTKISNSDEVHVLTYHKNVPISFLTAGANTNNAGQASNYAGRIFIGGKVVEQFVVSTDKLSSGIPSTGYGVAVYKSGEPLSEGELETNFLANSYAGIIQFNTKVGPSTAYTADVFEYKGAKLDAEVARIAAAVFGENGGGDEDVSLTQKVAQNTAAIATLNGDATKTGSVANTVSVAVSAAETRVAETTNALAGRIAQLEGIQHFSVVVVPEGQTMENVTPVENTIYLVKDANAAEGTYIEYIAYKPAGSESVVTEKIGSTALDLSGYTTDAEHTALAERVDALDGESGRVAVVEGKVSTLVDETIPALEKAITDGVTEAKTYAESQASAAQSAATNAASNALSAAVEQIGKDIEAAKNEAISSAEVTINQGTGIVVTGAGKGTTFTIAVSDAVATAASVTALSELIGNNKTELEGKITAASEAASNALSAAVTEIGTTTSGIDARLQTAEATIAALTTGDASVDTKIGAAVEELEGEISKAVESLEGQISQAQSTLQGNINGVSGRVTDIETDLTTGATAQAIAKAQSDATQALADAADVSTALDTAKSQSLAQTGKLTGLFSVATAGSVGAGITSITITDTGLSTAIAAAQSGAEQTAATALATARGEITTEISTAVSGLESKLTTGEDSLGAKVAALETATTTTLPEAIEQALEDAKAYSDSLHTTSLDYVVLGDSESLPTASADTLGKIYLVASQNAPTADGSAISGSYVEYMTRKVGEGETATYTWEKIGTTAADLNAYAKTSEVEAAVKVAQDAADKAQGEVDALETVVATLTQTHADDKATLEGYITGINNTIAAMDSNETVNGLTVTQVDGVITEIKEELITAYVPTGTTSVEGNVAYVGSTKHVIAPEKFQTAAQMPATLTSWVADLSNLTDDTAMFKGCTSLTTFVGDLSSLTNGTEMFSGCTSLTTFVGDLSALTSGVDMFSGCTLDKDSLEILADNLPTVTGGTIEIGAQTNATDEVISTIKNKGWTVTSNGTAL